MRAPHALRMRVAGLGPIVAVAPVLARERPDAVPGRVEGGHLRDAHDPPAGLPNAGRELPVLVDRPVLVPATMPQQRLPPPHARVARVDLELVARVAKRRAADPEPRAQGERDPARPLAASAGELWPAHPIDVATAKPLHAAGQIVGRVHRMRVHPRYELAPRVLEPDVECKRDSPLRVVENPDSRVLGGEALQQRSGRVLRAPVHEQELDVLVDPLRLQPLDGLEDVGLLVEGRRQDADPHRRPAVH